MGRGSTAVLANAEDGSWTHGREDSDAAASIEVPIHDCKKPTCIHADEVAGKYISCLILAPQMVLSLQQSGILCDSCPASAVLMP